MSAPATLKPATEIDLVRVGRAMREVDRRECWAAAHLSGDEALRQSFEHSAAPVVMEIDGEPACMAGVTPSDIEGVGVPWMLGTEVIERRQHAFLRGCLPWIAQAKRDWAALLNFVAAENTMSHRWLVWLGFTLGDPQPYGPDGVPFRPFWMGSSLAIRMKGTR